MMSLFGRRADWRVRGARDEDAADFARIHGLSFARGWSEEEFASLLSDAAVIAHVAVDRPGAAPAGIAISRLAGDEAEILSIALDPAWRRGGGGHALLAAHLAALAGRGVGRVILEVDEDNRAALGLYRRFGFEKVGLRPAYYARPDGERGNALVLASRLR